MLGAASPTLLGISLGTGPSGMTPRQSLTSSVYGESEIIIISHTTAPTENSSLPSRQGRSLHFRSLKADCITWTQLVHKANNNNNSKDMSSQ